LKTTEPQIVDNVQKENKQHLRPFILRAYLC